MIKWISALLLLSNCTLFLSSFALKGAKEESVSNCVTFSSRVDPEDCYSLGKAFGDVGVFPNKEFNGTGIKIGIIDDGIPYNLSYFNDYELYGTTYGTHPFMVADIINGPCGIAPNAKIYCASRYEYTFEECLRWLVEVEHVDVINHSMDFGLAQDQGRYTCYYSYYVDNYIKNHNVIFVNALGNSNLCDNIPSVSLGINVITAGANSSDLTPDPINAEGFVDGFDNVIEKPTVLAPGKDIYGFSTQPLSIPDTDFDESVSYGGTSAAAPIVTGIIALLLEEFPTLKGKPEAIQSIINCSKQNGIINYQIARSCAKNYVCYSVDNYLNPGAQLIHTLVAIPSGKTIFCNNFVLFNELYNHNGTDYVIPSQIIFSKFKVSLTTLSGVIVSDTISTKSNIFFSYLNESSNNVFFWLNVELHGNKAPIGVERASFVYRVGTPLDDYSLTTTNFLLDLLPRFDYSISGNYVANSASIFFVDFMNQIVFSKTNLQLSGSFILSLGEWHSLLSLRGKQFYVYMRVSNMSNHFEFSPIYVFNEPNSFGYLSNINPQDYSFPDAYNSTILTSYKNVEGTGISIKRLRCGYIQQQYINISPKKAGAGHAFLQLEFDSLIQYCSFGVTLWRDHELSNYNGDTAVVEIKDSNNNWVEIIDLLVDVSLPDSRKDILRFNVFTPLKGIRFDATSAAIGDWNKGRLCIDNISFTSDPYYNSYLCTFTEPIVVRETFEV